MGLAPMFNVAAQLFVNAFPPLRIDNLKGEGLLFEFNVSKTWGPSPDTASITVYNLDPVARAALSITVANFVGVGVQIFAGWGGILEQFYTGEIWKLTAARQTGTDVLTLIEAGVGSVALRDATPSGIPEFGIPIFLKIGQIFGELKRPLLPSAAAIVKARAAALPVSALDFTGNETKEEMLHVLMSAMGLTWGFAGDFAVVYKDGKRDDVLPLLIGPNSGALTWEETDNGGVSLTALGQPRVVPGMQLTVVDEKGIIVGGGPLRVESVAFNGSSESGFTMVIDARKAAVLG